MASTSQCGGQPSQPVRDEGGVGFSKKPSQIKFLLTLAAPVSLPPEVSGLERGEEEEDRKTHHDEVKMAYLYMHTDFLTGVTLKGEDGF